MTIEGISLREIGFTISSDQLIQANDFLSMIILAILNSISMIRKDLCLKEGSLSER